MLWKSDEKRGKIHKVSCSFIGITSQEYLVEELKLKNDFIAHNINKFSTRKLDSQRQMNTHCMWWVLIEVRFSRAMNIVQISKRNLSVCLRNIKYSQRLKEKTNTPDVCRIHTQRRKINFLIGKHCDFIVALTFLCVLDILSQHQLNCCRDMLTFTFASAHYLAEATFCWCHIFSPPFHIDSYLSTIEYILKIILSTSCCEREWWYKAYSK